MRLLNNMHCPSCNKDQLKQVQVSAHYGKAIAVDQCSNCRGIWFDVNEYYQIPENEILKLETAQTKNFKANKTGNILTCPNGHGKLIRFHDFNFPKDILIEKCLKCHELWFNKGELSLFHSWKISLAKKKTEKEKIKFDSEIEKMLESHSSTSSYSTLASLASFLSTPIERSQVSLNPLNPIGALFGIVRLFIGSKNDSSETI